jgi:hypothetical protein
LFDSLAAFAGNEAIMTEAKRMTNDLFAGPYCWFAAYKIAQYWSNPETIEK